MSEQIKNTKHEIEVIATNSLSKDKLKNFLSFIEFLKENKLSVRNQGGR